MLFTAGSFARLKVKKIIKRKKSTQMCRFFLLRRGRYALNALNGINKKNLKA